MGEKEGEKKRPCATLNNNLAVAGGWGGAGGGGHSDMPQDHCVMSQNRSVPEPNCPISRSRNIHADKQMRKMVMCLWMD